MSAYRNSNYTNTRRSTRGSNSSDGWLPVLLYYILPFIVINGIIFFCVTSSPKYTITVGDTHDYLSTEVTIAIDSWFPTKSVSLSMDSEEIELEKKSSRAYKAVIMKNGSLEVKVDNINGMSSTQFEHVGVLDDNPPSIDTSIVEDGLLTLTFSDSQSGVNLESIYALNSNDDVLSPLSLDRASSTVSFAMDPAGIRVFIQDMAGHTVQGTFTSHLEGSETTLEGGESDPEAASTEAAE